MAALGTVALGGAAQANCAPPYATLFACDIPERNARVEFCEIRDDRPHPGRGDHSYNYSVGAAPAELYFEADGYYFSTKYMDSGDTVGVGLKHGNYVYAFYVTGKYLERVDSAQIQVFDSVDAFQSDAKEVEVERRYCAPGSIILNWDTIAP
ncbi:hypothetical protein DRW48_05830 [Paracoccus suum]|uniref:Uncharacterized protein n=2 Tax=Paracoccus suum TaxID=2259340 RepID=A0A344PIR2_9RHOB|nr:hypothetical protein DRW48_05830 [Paracoccus suum]